MEVHKYIAIFLFIFVLFSTAFCLIYLIRSFFNIKIFLIDALFVKIDKYIEADKIERDKRINEWMLKGELRCLSVLSCGGFSDKDKGEIKEALKRLSDG